MQCYSAYIMQYAVKCTNVVLSQHFIGFLVIEITQVEAAFSLNPVTHLRNLAESLIREQ